MPLGIKVTEKENSQTYIQATIFQRNLRMNDHLDRNEIHNYYEKKKVLVLSLTRLHLIICSTPFTCDLLKFCHHLYPHVFFSCGRQRDSSKCENCFFIFNGNLWWSFNVRFNWFIFHIFVNWCSSKKGPSLCTVSPKWRLWFVGSFMKKFFFTNMSSQSSKLPKAGPDWKNHPEPVLFCVTKAPSVLQWSTPVPLNSSVQ